MSTGPHEIETRQRVDVLGRLRDARKGRLQLARLSPSDTRVLRAAERAGLAVFDPEDFAAWKITGDGRAWLDIQAAVPARLVAA